MMVQTVHANSEMAAVRGPSDPIVIARAETLSYFALTVLGFSFWFLMAVPFASHRETYWWLAKGNTESFTYALSFIASTYRPLHQVTTWVAFQMLDPNVFPTNVQRQALLQLCVYAMFVLGWWLIFSGAAHRRMLALTAFVVGAVFFSGYVQLFHIYGLSYVPVILTLGLLLRFWAVGSFGRHEAWFAGVSVVLVLWHPFTTALFVGFYFGRYLETFSQRSKAEHARAIAILAAGTAAVAALVVVVPRLWPEASPLLVETATRPLDSRLFGFLVSYRTNEVNGIATSVAFLLTQMVVVTIASGARLKLIAVVLATALSGVFLWNGVPLILLWLLVTLAKLASLRSWSILFLALTASILPFGGGIGTPMHSLFAIIIAAYVTALAWSQEGYAPSVVKTRYVNGIIVLTLAVLTVTRAGINVPFLETAARPLLVERERTYQLENVLAWLHKSEYCLSAVSFVDVAGNPIDSAENVITRQHRPPSSLGDVQLFWNTVLRCGDSEHRKKAGTAIVTFDGPVLADAEPVFEVEGQYGGSARVWIKGHGSETP